MKQVVVFDESEGVINRLVTEDEEDELEDIAGVWNSRFQFFLSETIVNQF